MKYIDYCKDCRFLTWREVPGDFDDYRYFVYASEVRNNEGNVLGDVGQIDIEIEYKGSTIYTVQLEVEAYDADSIHEAVVKEAQDLAAEHRNGYEDI